MTSTEAKETTAVPDCLPARGRNAAELGAIFLLYFLALSTVASSLLKHWGFPLDDSYIHQTVARTFTHPDVPGFVAGRPSSGATSPLWLLIQSGNLRFLHVDPVSFNLALSGIFLVLIGAILFALARRDGFTARNALLLAAAPSLSGNFIWLGLIGMEHLLFVAVTLVAIWCWTHPDRILRSVLAGGCAGVLSLIRPESIIFMPIFVAAGIKQKRPHNQLSIFFSAWLPFCILLFCFNAYTSHALLPSTWKGRAWLYSHATNSNPIAAFFAFTLQWFLIRAMQFSASCHSPFFFVGWAVPIGFLVGVGADWLCRNGREAIRTLFLLAAAHFIIFGLMLPSPGHAGRYQPLNLLLFFPCLYFGSRFVLQKLFSREKLACRVSIALCLCAGLISLLCWRRIAADGIEVTNETHKPAAQWLARNLPSHTRVAVFDIGAISYEGRQQIVDLGGLIDPAYLPYLQTRRAPEYLQAKQTTYAVIPSDGMAYELGFGGPSLHVLKEFCAPFQPWSVAFFYTLNAARCQIIYRIRRP